MRKACTQKSPLLPWLFPLYDVQRCKRGTDRIMNDAPTSAPATIAARLRSLGISRRRPLTVTSHVFCCFQYMPISANCQPGRRQKKGMLGRRWGLSAPNSAGSIVATPHDGEIAPFRLISPPMKFPPQAVIGGSSRTRGVMPLDPHLRKKHNAENK